jgi:hypothetical protein
VLQDTDHAESQLGSAELHHHHVIFVDVVHVAAAAILEPHERVHVAGLQTAHADQEVVDTYDLANWIPLFDQFFK